MNSSFKKKAAGIKLPLGILLILLLTGVALSLGSPAGAAAGMKALAIIFIIAIGLLIGKAYRRIFKR